MAERVIRIGDLAAALAGAGSAPVPALAAVTEVRLELFAQVHAVDGDAAFWAMTLRQPRRRLAGFAWLRRWRRRREGWFPRRLSLRWTPKGLEAAVEGRLVARINFPTTKEDLR